MRDSAPSPAANDAEQIDFSGIDIVVGYPPNIDAIDAVFHVREKIRLRQVNGPLIVYGNTIYNPLNARPPRSLLVHEATHVMQQTKRIITPEKWWDRYLSEPDFRLREEIEAHRNEFRQAVLDDGSNRQARKRNLKIIAQKLSGVLYNRMISFADAKREILGESSFTQSVKSP